MSCYDSISDQTVLNWIGSINNTSSIEAKVSAYFAAAVTLRFHYKE